MQQENSRRGNCPCLLMPTVPHCANVAQESTSASTNMQVKVVCFINNLIGLHQKTRTQRELTHLFNESIRTGIFPREWVIGNITPIPKEGDPLDPNNWRPVTILPLPSKLLEKAVHYQLMNYFQNQNLLDERQHGFRKDFSTATATFK